MLGQGGSWTEQSLSGVDQTCHQINNCSVPGALPCPLCSFSGVSLFPFFRWGKGTELKAAECPRARQLTRGRARI